MAQHVTTLNEIREGMEQTDVPETSDLVYCERGNGSDRARAFRVDEIAQKSTESLGDDGDIKFTPYTGPGGVGKTKGEIKDGTILGKMFSALVQLWDKKLRWSASGTKTTQVDKYGLFFWNENQDPDEDQNDTFHFDNDGVVQLSKIVSKARSLNQEGDKATQTEYRSMTNCELHAGNGTTLPATPELYLTAVEVGTSGYDSFELDSTRHGVGSIVMVMNTGVSTSGENSFPVKCYLASDTSHTTVIKEIPKYGIALFIRMADVNNLPVWRAIV